MELENSDYNYCLLNDEDNDQIDNQETNLKEAQNEPNEEPLTKPNDLLEDNKEINNNIIDKPINSKEEKAELNLNVNKEDQNQNSNSENKINNIMEETPRNKEKSQLALEIGNVIENSLTQIKKEELKEFYDLKTDDELNEFIDKAKANKDSNDLSIHPGSSSLSQLTGMNSKENGSSITPGNTYNSDFLEELTKNLPKKILAGLPNREYFITKYLNNYNNILYNPYDYKYQEVKDDGNGGYRCIALQLFGNEEFHNDIRMDVYNFLHHNKENFTHLTFQVEGKEVTSEEYIEHIKEPGFEMGDLELYVMNLIYNAILFIFQLKDEDELTLIHIKGNLKNSNSILLTICIVDENHFSAVYEKYRSPDLPVRTKKPLNIDMESILSNTLITDINIAYELNYAADNRKYRYKDMINYMISKKFNREPTYPDFIYDIKTKQLRTNKKKEFKKSLKNYFIDEKTKRLKVKFNFSKVKELLNKEYFIPFQIEKIKLIKHLHESATHKGQVLSELVKKSDYWWYGVYQDVKNSANYCPLCHKKPKTKIIKPRPFLNKNIYGSNSDEITPK